MADVVKFPKRYTSYRVAYLPFPDSPMLHFTMQCPYDKLDEFLEHLFAMAPEEAYYYEVHGHLADGTVDVVRGDISKDQPRGRVYIKLSALIFPGSSMADAISVASKGYSEEQRQKMTAGVKRRNSLSVRVPMPASPSISQQATLDHIESYKQELMKDTPATSLMDSQGKPRFTWDAQKAQYVEKATGHCITQSQWAEMKEKREAAKLNRPLANTSSPSYVPPADVVAAELNRIVADVDNPLSVFPVVLTSIEIEEFK